MVTAVPTTTLRDVLAMNGGVLRIAVVADSHSAPHPRCLEHLAAAKPDRILHAGDIGNLQVLDRLATVAPETVRYYLERRWRNAAGKRAVAAFDVAG